MPKHHAGHDPLSNGKAQVPTLVLTYLPCLLPHHENHLTAKILDTNHFLLNLLLLFSLGLSHIKVITYRYNLRHGLASMQNEVPLASIDHPKIHMNW